MTRQRAAGLLSRLLAQARPAAIESGLAGTADPLAGVPACSCPISASFATCSSSRRYSSSWEGHWTSARRTQLQSDVVAARSMLPHRGQFVPQFTPHGFQLIPESLLSPLTALQVGDAAVATLEGAAAAAAAADQPCEQQQQQQQQQRWDGAPAASTPLYADSVKRKRKLKMKKHKYRKRMRALKAQLGK